MMNNNVRRGSMMTMTAKHNRCVYTGITGVYALVCVYVCVWVCVCVCGGVVVCGGGVSVKTRKCV